MTWFTSPTFKSIPLYCYCKVACEIHCYKGKYISTGILKGMNNQSITKDKGGMEISHLYSFNLRGRLPYIPSQFLLIIDKNTQIADPSHSPVQPYAMVPKCP